MELVQNSGLCGHERERQDDRTFTHRAQQMKRAHTRTHTHTHTHTHRWSVSWRGDSDSMVTTAAAHPPPETVCLFPQRPASLAECLTGVITTHTHTQRYVQMHTITKLKNKKHTEKQCVTHTHTHTHSAPQVE